MVDVERILGPKAWNRLKTAGYDNIDKIRSLTPEKIMEIAGIGIEKTNKLFRAMQMPVPKAEIRRDYQRLNIRTKLKNIGAAIKEPRPTIKKLEDLREGLTRLANVTRALHNIGKPSTEKLPELRYYPVPLVLEPFAPGIRAPAPVQLGEIWIQKTVKNIEVRTQIINGLNSHVITESTNYLEPEPATTLNTILDVVRKTHNNLRTVSDGLFLIIIDPEYQSIRERLELDYAREIGQNKTAILSGTSKEYYKWSVINKYLNNKTFQELLVRFNAWNSFYEYETYLRTRPSDQLTHDEYMEEPMYYDQKTFQPIIYAKGDDWVKLNRLGPPIYFGIIEGVLDNRYWDYDAKGYKKTPGPTLNTRFPTYEEFLVLKTRQEYLGERALSEDIVAMIGFVLDNDYDLWTVSPNSPIIITSTTIPDIGFIIGGE